MPTAVGIVESFGSGAVVRVEAFDQASGSWVEDTGPDFANFRVWLAWIADELTAGHGPPRWPEKKKTKKK